VNNEFAHLRTALSVEAILGEPTSVSPLRKSDGAPVSDGAAAMVLVAGDKARELCKRPVWIRGMDHRVDPHHIGMRNLIDSPSTRAAARGANLDSQRVEIAELHTSFSHYEPILRKALNLPSDANINPSGGPLCGDPTMVTGLTRIGEAARRIMRGDADYGVAHATSGPCLQQNLICTLGVS
jgi:acetyl-CoA acetyltransferase